MKVLVACEESQAVCKAFRRLGHIAYSCDLKPCSGGHPEWHIMGDVLPLLKYQFWDLLVAHPPCTHLAASGAVWWPQKIADGRQQEAIEFFMALAECDIPMKCIENPVGLMSTVWRKPDQIIQPWEYALDESEITMKTTCLWLEGLPPLRPLHTRKPEIKYFEWYDPKSGRIKRQTEWYYKTRCAGKQRAELASKTFPGIAKAMAEQWGGVNRE